MNMTKVTLPCLQEIAKDFLKRFQARSRAVNEIEKDISDLMNEENQLSGRN